MLPVVPLNLHSRVGCRFSAVCRQSVRHKSRLLLLITLKDVCISRDGTVWSLWRIWFRRHPLARLLWRWTEKRPSREYTVVVVVTATPTTSRCWGGWRGERAKGHARWDKVRVDVTACRRTLRAPANYPRII